MTSTTVAAIVNVTVLATASRRRGRGLRSLRNS